MGKSLSNLWDYIKRVYQGQQVETASATLLGIGISWNWLSSAIPHWIAIYFWPTIIALKAIFIAGASSLATNYVSYRFKKYIDGKEKTSPRRRKKKAA